MLLTAVLWLLSTVLTARLLLRLVISVLEPAVLRCAVCALLLVVRLAVGRRGWGPVALVLLRIPAVPGLLLIVRVRLRLAVGWCAAVATLLLLLRVVAGLVVIAALVVGVVAGHGGLQGVANGWNLWLVLLQCRWGKVGIKEVEWQEERRG